MELQLSSSFPILVTFFLFLFMFLNILKRSRTISPASKLPPGPWKLPIIGNMHQMIGTLPHHTLRDLAKKYGPLMHLKLGQVSTIVVSSPEFAKQVMKTHDIVFASRPQILFSKVMAGSSSIAFSPYGEYWRQLRKICIQEVLSIKQVQSYQPIREEELSNLVQLIGSYSGSAINLTDMIYSSTYGITSKSAFGNKCKEQERFVSVIAEVVEAAAGFNLADLFPSVHLLHLISGMRTKLERLHQEADSVLETIINEHKVDNERRKHLGVETEDDLVDVLLKFHDHGDLDLDLDHDHDQFSLTTDNIKAVIQDIYGGGSETSATTVVWAMSEMIKNPRVMKKAQDEVREVFERKGLVDETGINEMKYLKCVTKEVLRLHPPAPLLLPRECRERCEINGYEIPVKARVVVNAWAIGRDPKYWTEPESFYPERFIDSSVDFKGTNFEYIPFGAGRRICPGMAFGIINVELPLAYLLYHFDWKLPNGMKHEDLNMTESFGLAVRRKDDMHLVPLAYCPSPVENPQPHCEN